MEDVLTIGLEVAAALRSRRYRLVTAESCTGGLIASTLTEIPGSSDWFEGAFVTYRLSAKTRMLGVNPEMLKRFGAVSEPVARAMAEGALDHSDADLAISVTGLAGPDGGDPTNPVGTVWLAWADRHRTPPFLHAEKLSLSGNRRAVRAEAVSAALSGLLRALPGAAR